MAMAMAMAMSIAIAIAMAMTMGMAMAMLYRGLSALLHFNVSYSIMWHSILDVVWYGAI